MRHSCGCRSVTPHGGSFVTHAPPNPVTPALAAGVSPSPACVVMRQMRTRPPIGIAESIEIPAASAGMTRLGGSVNTGWGRVNGGVEHASWLACGGVLARGWSLRWI